MASTAIQLNNPGHLGASGTTPKWRGVVDNPDSTLLMFKAPVWGIRAMVRILMVYEEQGNITLESIVSRWLVGTHAAGMEPYIASVEKHTNTYRHENLDITNWRNMQSLVTALIRVENGEQPYGNDIIRKALILAGYEIDPKPLVESRTAVGSVVSVSATTLNVVTVELEKHTELLQSLSDKLDIAQYSLLAIALFGAGVALWARIKDAKLGIRS